jgi:enoyl-CoA hydratase/carnithine racemase
METMTQTPHSPPPTSDNLLFEVIDGVALVTFNRPEVRNALDDAMRQEFIGLLDYAGQERSIRALVLTGNGKAFCAGGDVRAMRERMAAPPGQVAFNGWARQQRTHHAVLALHEFSKPTVAAVNGAAAGLGCDLALCCDFVMTADNATFAMSYILRGLIPDGGGMYFLPRRVGLAKAKELIYTGRTVAAQEAHAIGMADRLVPADTLLSDACEWARTLGAGSQSALALGKAILNRSLESTAAEVFALGSQAQGICYSTEEHRNSVESFLSRSSKKQ